VQTVRAAKCSSSLSLVLARSWFYLLDELCFVAGCLRIVRLGLGDRLRDMSPRVGYGPSVFRGAVLVVRVPFSNRPPRPHGPFAGPCGLSAKALRTVLPRHCRLAKPFISWVALPCCFELGFVPRVGRSVVTTWPWQTHVGIFGC
jgi:hypothetical protein